MFERVIFEMWNLLEEGLIPKFGNDLYRLVDLHRLMGKLGGYCPPYVQEHFAANALGSLRSTRLCLLSAMPRQCSPR
jgi:hypothetical protein